MGRRGAFFDLDRTLLAGASGPAFARALEQQGFGGARRVPGQSVLLHLYEWFGESLLVMQFAKRSVVGVRGLERAAVRAAAEAAAPLLEGAILPHVRPLLAEHRARGDRLVMATTSPRDLVSPLAARLGFDAVVATAYAEEDGLYTGAIAGEFVWGSGKLRAVQAWCDRAGVDLRVSTAYSDSIFDYPLLDAVAHPVAVNPDPRLRALALLRRWPIRHLDAPAGVPRVVGAEPFDVLRRIVRPEMFPYARFRFEGLDHLPRRGPAILAANHRSYFDPIALALAGMRAGRNLRFMGKKEVFDAPVVGTVARLLGGIRVDRGAGSDQPLREAAAALGGGEVVAILPQGTIPRGEALSDPVLVGRTGVARLAQATGAPVIPVGLWGTEHVWRRDARLPDVWRVTSPPEVVVRVGSAVGGLTGVDLAADTGRVMDAIMALLREDPGGRATIDREAISSPSGPPGSG